MNEPSGEAAQPEIPEAPRENWPVSKKALIYAAAALALLLIAFIPVWTKASERTRQIDLLHAQLRFVQIQNNLATAAIDARRGDYEPGRQAAAEFFTGLAAELQRPGTSYTAEQRQKLSGMLDQRDDLITLLARSDPGSAERLSQMHVDYRQVLRPAPAPPAPAKQSD